MLARTPFFRATAILLAAGVVAACASAPADPDLPMLEASAVLRDPAGRTLGTVALAQARSGEVTFDVSVAGLSVGSHGIHLHAVGSCEASGTTAFGAAGGHFNPLARSHGLDNPQGSHGGDLPNLVVAADGTGRLRTTTTRVSLTAGAISLSDADGSAVVVHAGPDDQVSDPAGNSGARVACGVIQAR